MWASTLIRDLKIRGMRRPVVACSRRSDSGVRREGREEENNKEEKRERGGNYLRNRENF